MEEYNQTRCTRVVDRSKTVQNQKAFEPYLDLVHYNDLCSAGAMEEYNRTHCTRVVDRSKTVQNQKAFEPYQDLVHYNDLHSALERWRNTTGPVVCVWLIIPKLPRTKKPLNPIKI